MTENEPEATGWSLTAFGAGGPFVAAPIRQTSQFPLLASRVGGFGGCIS